MMNFDPNGVGLNNGNFVGLPFTKETAELVLFPISWDVTTSFRPGTSRGPKYLLEASYQLDLGSLDNPGCWKKGIFYYNDSHFLLTSNDETREKAALIIKALENGESLADNSTLSIYLREVNAICKATYRYVHSMCQEFLEQGKKIGIIGGDHSAPLGYYKALAECHPEYGILQIDAHCDLRLAYEGFTYSHASVMRNALEFPEVTKLVQVGIRDFCEEELQQIKQSEGRIVTFFDQNIREQLLEGSTFAKITQQIVDALPQKVHISLDVDGLLPHLCPNTGTPVPGGLNWGEFCFLVKAVRASGREIIGFDVCEVGAAEWDGNVGARAVLELAKAFL